MQKLTNNKVFRKIVEFLKTYRFNKSLTIFYFIVFAFFSQFFIGKDNAFEQLGEYILKAKLTNFLQMVNIEYNKELIDNIDFSK